MHRAITSLSIALLVASPAMAIDFTPRVMIENADGVTIHRNYFADGSKNYGIKLSAGVALSAQNGGALFTFGNFVYATMLWRSSPFPAGIAFDAAHLPQYLMAATQFLPKGSTDVKVEAEEANVYPINHWICHRYTISYAFYGSPMRDTVTFLNLNEKEQIVIQVSSTEADAGAVAAAAWNIIRSWHEMVAQPNPPGN